MTRSEAPADAVRCLQELSAREAQLQSALSRLERDEPLALKAIEKAQRSYDAESVGGLRVPSDEIARGLEAAKRRFSDLDSERNAAREELAEIRAARLDVIGHAAKPTWTALQRVRAAQYQAAIDLAAKVEKLVGPFSALVDEEKQIGSDFDALLAPLGLRGALIRDDCRREFDEVAVPDTSEARQALRRAARVRQLYAEDLTYRW